MEAYSSSNLSSQRDEATKRVRVVSPSLHRAVDTNMGKRIRELEETIRDQKTEIQPLKVNGKFGGFSQTAKSGLARRAHWSAQSAIGGSHPQQQHCNTPQQQWHEPTPRGVICGGAGEGANSP